MDQITIEAARRGDRGAQAALLRELQDVWFRFCLGLLGNADDARDAAQETALRFLRDLPRFRGDSSISTWSIGIAVNVTREMRRKARPMKLLDSDEDAGAADQDSAAGPDERLLAGESQSLVRSTLNGLPQRQREALLLRYFEGLSLEEAAAAMGCAVGTVKATLHQALRVLRTKLRQLA